MRRVSADGSTWDVEALLGDALRPIEPPERLSGRIEDTLAAVTQAAAEELSDWAEELSESELRALRDPRNWVRPVVAVGAGGVATGALVLLELRRRGRQQGESGLRSLAGGLRSRPVALRGALDAGFGVPRRGGEAEQAEDRCRQSSAPLAGRKPRIASPVPMAKPQIAERGVEQADARARSRARRSRPAAGRARRWRRGAG